MGYFFTAIPHNKFFGMFAFQIDRSGFKPFGFQTAIFRSVLLALYEPAVTNWTIPTLVLCDTLK